MATLSVPIGIRNEGPFALPSPYVGTENHQVWFDDAGITVTPNRCAPRISYHMFILAEILDCRETVRPRAPGLGSNLSPQLIRELSAQEPAVNHNT
jgi:hypothetical protein